MCTSNCTLIFVSSAAFVPAVKNVIPASTQGCIQGFSICLRHHTAKEKFFCLPEYDTIVMLISTTGISHCFCYKKCLLTLHIKKKLC